MRSHTALTSLALLCFCTAAHSATSRCTNGGIGGDPLVPNATVARAIYRAVADATIPGSLRRFPIIVVQDAGDHWSITQAGPHNEPVRFPKAKPNEETVIMTMGGGQFYVDIDKCTGAISNAALNR